MIEEISIRGIIPDFSIFTSKDNLEAFMAIARLEEIKKTPISSGLYHSLEEERFEKTSTLLRKWERKKVPREWVEELRRYREMFVPCDEIMKSDEYVERWNRLPEKVKRQIQILFEKSKQNPLVEALAEMLIVSLIMDFPIVAFSRQFQRQLRFLEIPTFDTLIACFEHLKRLKRKKNGWYKQLLELHMRIKGHKLPLGKIILITVAIATGLAAWQVVGIILSLNLFTMSEVAKEAFEQATGILIGAVIVNGLPV